MRRRPAKPPRDTPMPGTVRVLRTRVIHGPNRWSRLPLIHLRVDLGELERYPTDRLPGFGPRLLAALPGLHDHHCSRGRPGGFARRIEDGTWMGHVVEHVALELQRQAGGRSTRGKTRAAGPPGHYDVVFAYDDEQVGLAAGREAISLVNGLLERPGPAPDLTDALDRLRTLAEGRRLGVSTQAIVDVARRRHIPWRRLNDENLVQLGWGVHTRRIRATVTSETSLIGAELARDKAATGLLLERAGLPVAPWREARSAAEALGHAATLGLPVVVKPVDGNHGRGVTLDVSDPAAIEAAFDRAARASRRGVVMVQRHVPGRDFRMLVIGGRLAACAERLPAAVEGDGRSTVTELVARENADPRRGAGHSRPLTRIGLDAASDELLRSQGLTRDDVPARGRRVVLSAIANLSAGGTSIDRTDEVHPEVAGLAVLAARVIGLDVAGIDLVAPGVDRPLRETGGAIIELNAAPGFRMHTHPTSGRGRNVGGAVLDWLMGRGSEGRIPVAAVTGSNGKTTTVRLLAHILATSGRPTGLTSTESIVADGLVLATGDMAGPASARLLLSTPTIEAAVLEVARGGILRDGLGYDYNDVAIVTNVTGDHLGLDGITTLAELADVKSVIVQAVPRTGTAVLNADDPLVLDMARHSGGAVALTSTARDRALAGPAAVRRHAKTGGLTGVIEASDGVERLVVRRGAEAIVSVAVAEIPFTWRGAARMHVANALMAACGAVAMGLQSDSIEAGLRSFVSSPGRAERHVVDGREIVLDYGHNVAALRALGELVAMIRGERRVLGVVSMPGDRRDEDRAALGALAGTIFDRLFVAEPAIRGRAPGEAAGIMIDAARGGERGAPSRCGEPTFVPDEADASVAALADSRPEDLMVLCVSNGPRVLAALGAAATSGRGTAAPAGPAAGGTGASTHGEGPG